MTKRLLIGSLALVLVAGISFASPKDGSWTGWVTDTMLYNPADKKVYTLDPQEKLAEHAGHFVKVTGSVDGDTIKVKAIEMAPEPQAEAAKPKS
ncbi:MAG: hypothetical protein HYR58_00185 [Acidobacteria bacterium]|nr:hypothetical protein [Acidobacteriota bacterium]